MVQEEPDHYRLPIKKDVRKRNGPDFGAVRDQQFDHIEPLQDHPNRFFLAMATIEKAFKTC
jgi:hypothetical protein